MNKKLTFIVIFLTVLFAFGVTFSYLFLFEKIQTLETKVNKLSPITGTSEVSDQIDAESIVPEKDDCGEACQKVVNDIVTKAISTVSSKTKEIAVRTVSEKTNATAYVPMGTTYTTTSTDWYTVNDTAIYIDLIKEYGKSATVSWEASLKVAHGNGQAYVRLWDDTNKIAVNGSELTTINNVSYSLVSSGNLPFWNGRNLYKLQIKSLNSFEVSVTGGKIKIQY